MTLSFWKLYFSWVWKQVAALEAAAPAKRQTCGGFKAVGINVVISLPAAGRDAPQSMSTTATDGKHMQHLGSDAAPACANGHMRRLMRVSSPKTQIQRTYLQQRRWEPSDYFCDLCRDADINKGCTHTCTPTHAEHHYWRLLLHFSWSLLYRENDFQFHLRQPWKKHRDLAVMTKAILSRGEDSARRLLHGVSARLHGPKHFIDPVLVALCWAALVIGGLRTKINSSLVE